MTMTVWASAAAAADAAAQRAYEPNEPTGASLAWTSQDPRIAAARELLLRGELAKAEQSLAGEAGTSADETREVIRRTRREYGQDEATLLGKLRKEIPDVTAADLRRWREAGQ